MCYDPKAEILITNINRLAAVIRMLPRAKIAQLEKEQPRLLRTETGRQTGTPYIMKRDYLFKPDEAGYVMPTAPPSGTLLAIDLLTGLKKWAGPLGYMTDPGRYPWAEQWPAINCCRACVA